MDDVIMRFRSDADLLDHSITHVNFDRETNLFIKFTKLISIPTLPPYKLFQRTQTGSVHKKVKSSNTGPSSKV